MLRLQTLRTEQGQALVAGVAISFVVMVLVITLLAVSVHTNDATVHDRSRSQGIQSAEAAVSVVIDKLARSVCVPDVGISSPSSLSAQGQTVGQYQAIVRLPAEAGVLTPATWDPNNTTGAGCTTAPPATNDRVITAWGYGPSATSSRKVLRKIEVNVRIAPLAGFRFVCYAGGAAPQGVLSVSNNMVVNGNCYARTVSSSYNNLIDNGTLMSPGSITTKNNTTYQGNIWGGGAVTMGNNTTVTGYVTSATSSIYLNQNARVMGNATAGTTITLDNNAAIDGTRCPAVTGAPGCPTNPPPTLAMPTLKCTSADVVCWGTVFPGLNSAMDATTLSAWLDANKSSLAGSYYVSGTGQIDFTKGGTITGPLTIVTTGKIKLSRDLVTPNATTPPVACTPSGGTRTCLVTIISMSPANDAIEIEAPRFTANAPTISVLLYTTGTILAEGGANPTTFTGAFYAENLDIQSNGTTVNQSQDLIDYPPPFVNWTASSAAQFAVEPIAWRERPPASPA